MASSSILTQQQQQHKPHHNIIIIIIILHTYNCSFLTCSLAFSLTGLLTDAGAPEPDDFELYLLLAAAEYVLQTKDVTFLIEPVHAYNTSRELPLASYLIRALDFVIDTVGRGPHGLLRLLSSDW